jgi:hypothetical protein
VIAGPTGNFTITVKDGAVLAFSFVGFDLYETAAVAGQDMNIVLLRVDRSYSEIVVTALGIRKEKKKISYATQEVKGSALEKVPESNIATNLIGKLRA